MIEPYEAAWELHRFLRGLGAQYAIIGGIAVQFWGEPRATRDVDITAAAPEDDQATFIDRVQPMFPSRVSDLPAFARRTRVLPVQASNGVAVDISLAAPGYESRMLERAVELPLAPRRRVRFCTAEDLVIHKAVAGRGIDVQDIRGIITRQRDRLDARYIRRWLREFSAVLESPELLERFEAPWRQLHRG